MNALTDHRLYDSASSVMLAGNAVNTWLPANDTPEPLPEIRGRATVNRADLTAALDKLKRVTERRMTIPVLCNVLIVTAFGEMALTATDLDITMTVTITAGSSDDFTATIPCQLLADICKKAKASESVSFHVDSGQYRPAVGGPAIAAVACVTLGGIDYRLQTITPADFPELSPRNYFNRFAMPGKELFGMLDAVQVAISTEETRYYLNGVYLHVAENWFAGECTTTFRATATDGHRAYLQDAGAVPDGAAGMPGVIVPRKAVALFLGLAKGKACPPEVRVAIDAANTASAEIRLEWGNVSMRCKLIDGTFPDYARVIPTMNDNVARFDRDAMAEMLASVSLISSERGRAVKFGFEDGYCQLSVSNPDSGSASGVVEGISWLKDGHAADPLEIGINAKYLADMLDDAGAGEIVGEFGDAGSPVVFRSSRAGWKAVQMPMRV